MPQLTLAPDQKAQLKGWLNREKDYLLSIKSMAQQIIVPSVTDTLELIKRDFEFIFRVREAVPPEGDDSPIELADEDLETLIDVARSNRYANRDVFWRGIIEAATASQG